MTRVRKRDGRLVSYERDKIIAAMEKAFIQENEPVTKKDLESILLLVEAHIEPGTEIEVEAIQDRVELALMESDHFKVAKSYILYRDDRRKKRAVRVGLASYFPEIPSLKQVLEEIEFDFPDESYDLRLLQRKFTSFYKEGLTPKDQIKMLIKAAVELTTDEASQWEFIAGRFYALLFNQEVTEAWEGLDGRIPASFSDKISRLEALGYYGPHVGQAYSQAELNLAATWIDLDREKLLTYSGYELLTSRYVIRSHKHQPLETVGEMYLGIALFLAIPEKQDRLGWARRFYDILSSLKVTMATPTLSNARKPYHQLSSCFVDTVPDDLKGIYRSISNFANVSKYGGGMGLYFGKVRAQGSTIRGFEGAAGGVIRWIRLANDTAVAVDQLGVRQGAVACYLDVWHKDLPEFLMLRTNSGDDRMKAHDVFPAVCFPDYFWDQVRTNMNGDWGLVDPHEILMKKGYSLEDTYGEDWTDKYLDILADPQISKRWIPIKEVVRLIIKSAVETGTPFIFNRDIVNRANPNRDKGMIYCSNLCTEIAQNMAPSEEVSQEIITENGDPVVVTSIRPGDYVVCNLASLNLGRIDVLSKELEEVTRAVVRALDNVIDLNYFPVPDAKVNNLCYRPIGLGVSGYHHMLVQHGIQWESEDHLTFVDKVFEDINYYTIKSSVEIAEAKGAYPHFQGSLWQSGAYFDERDYVSDRWQALRAKTAKVGIRNGYLLAVAPTASTSIIAGTTAGIDPIMSPFYYDEKKSGLIPRVAPGLTLDNYLLYQPAHFIDQSWSIRACGVRTRHIDQAQSMNLYITNDYTFRQILNLYLMAHDQGVKTLYYIRYKILEVEECAACAL